MVAEPLPRQEVLIADPSQIGSSLSESQQRWWLLVLLFAAMLIGYASQRAERRGWRKQEAWDLYDS